MDFYPNNEPLFEQIVKRIRQYIEAGVYRSDEKLPSVREFAQAMNVNPKTVVRAYDVLEKEGVLYSLQKKGYFVTPTQTENKEKYISDFKKMLALASSHLTKEEMQKALDEFEEERK